MSDIIAKTVFPVSSFDVERIRKDFPILSQKVYGKPLIYLDNAATSQKPQVVIDALVKYYSEYNANIHRGVHFLSQKASLAYDEVRNKVHRFINADSDREIVFVRGTTEGINLVASTYGRKNIGAGDEVIISAMEHHSNIVPWQLLCEEKGAFLKVIPINEQGEIIFEEFEKLITAKTKLVSVTCISNSLGTINPIKKIIEKAHQHGVPVMVDAAQAVSHFKVDVQDLDCDFMAFSSHKMFGPTGTGVLYGKMKFLEELPPYQGGGDMIKSVSFAKTTYNDIPFKFEAGTPNIADVIAFGAAIDYFNALNRNEVESHERELMDYATEQLAAINGLRIIGTSKEKAGVISFVLDGINAMDAGMYLDTLGIAVRTGQHCTEPVMDFFNIPGTIRASFLFYNTKSEIDALVDGVNRAIKLLK
ncbi:MAG: cysteine desulfurase [Bacteroidota bacterium]